MPGLSLNAGLRGQFGGAAVPATMATPGTPDGGMGGVTAAAFQPGATPTTNPGKGLGALHPGKSFGLAFWMGVGAIGLLIFIRSTLPR